MTKQSHANKKKCGAKTRSGSPCKNDPMPNGRCRMHGGKAGAPKGNSNSKKHGFFSKYIPQDTMKIIEDLESQSTSDMIWGQILIQYSAIIRAQKVMAVADRDDHLKEQVSEGVGDGGHSEGYKGSFAYEQYYSYLTAQSRAMSELRSLIKQFEEIADEKDERRARIDKIKSEAEVAREKAKQLKGEQKDTSLMEALIETVDDNGED